MTEKKVQIGFRVSEAFQRRIETERLKRDLSVQDMIQFALELYFKTPVEWDFADVVYHQANPETTSEEIQERSSWAELWVKYMNEMPLEKAQFMAEVMKLDLLHYKSSRRKGGLKSRPRSRSKK
jgi:hypothetical protein